MFLAVLLAALKGRGVMVRVVLCGFVVSGVLVAHFAGARTHRAAPNSLSPSAHSPLSRARDAELSQRRHLLLLRSANQISQLKLFIESDKATPVERDLLRSALSEEELPPNFLRKRIDLADVQFFDGKSLGTGTFGHVCTAQWRDRRVAVKRMHRHRINEAELQFFKRSVEVELSLSRHPNVAQLLGLAWSVETAGVMLVMELCPGGNLAQLLSRPLTWANDRLPIAEGVAAGLAFLHHHRVIHRDIKPENILLDAGNQTKICDFGRSRFMESPTDSTILLTADANTPIFAAPELLRRLTYEYSVDIWAFGGVLACMHFGTPLPYSEEQMAAQPSSVGMLDAVAAGTLQPELPQGHFCHKLVRDCCQYAPSKRPSAADLAIRLQTSAMAELARQADSRAEHKLD